MDIIKLIEKKLEEKNYGITEEVAKKYNFELCELYRTDAIFILKNELKGNKKNG